LGNLKGFYKVETFNAIQRGIIQSSPGKGIQAMLPLNSFSLYFPLPDFLHPIKMANMKIN